MANYFDNIKNVLTYLLTGNIAEVLIVFIGMFIVSTNNGEMFNPIQLLYINLITDSVPAIKILRLQPVSLLNFISSGDKRS